MSSQATEARTVPVIQSVAESAAATAELEVEPGVHFLTDDQNNTLVIVRADEPDGGGVYEPDSGGETTPGASVRSKNELLEYLIRDDGSVACKLCGEVLASRTHWYRHKYKLHTITGVVPASPGVPATVTASVSSTATTTASTPTATVVTAAGMNPSPLFRCVHCNVFFKSRKGYMGHVSARHSSEGEEETVVPVADAVTTETVITAESPPNKTARRKDSCPRGADWEQQREKEEKLVADIIDRVRRECEAQGAAVSRRGYSRRSTVMNTCN